MKLLAIDTATEALSAALWVDGEIIERYSVVTREHAARLPLLIPELMAEAGLSLRQLDGLVCGIGPGSFAGVRIGVSYVKGLALGLGRPVVGVGSLAMLAQAALNRHPEATALAAIDARMEEVYFGAYRMLDGIATAVQDDVVGPACAIRMPASSTHVAIGSGWAVHADALLAHLEDRPQAIDSEAFPRSSAALKIAVGQFATGQATDAALLVPAYLRNRVALTKREQQALRDSRT